MSDSFWVFPSRYDDYDYGEVNQLLERNLKVYIKTVACYPEKTTRRMYNHFWRHFRHSEKVRLVGEEQDGSLRRRRGLGTQRGPDLGIHPASLHVSCIGRQILYHERPLGSPFTHL